MDFAGGGSVRCISVAIKQCECSGGGSGGGGGWYMLQHCRFAQAFEKYNRMIWVHEGR